MRKRIAVFIVVIVTIIIAVQMVQTLSMMANHVEMFETLVNLN